MPRRATHTYNRPFLSNVQESSRMKRAFISVAVITVLSLAFIAFGVNGYLNGKLVKYRVRPDQTLEARVARLMELQAEKK